MRKIVLLTLLFVPVSVWASFDPGVVQNFNSLDSWSTLNSVCCYTQNQNSFARLGGYPLNSENHLTGYFTPSKSGLYQVKFEYRFTGSDYMLQDDAVLVSLKGPGTGSVLLSATSQHDLASGCAWKKLASGNVYLQKDRQYCLDFMHDESVWGYSRLKTFLDVDNVSLTRVCSVPVPGSLLLTGIGLTIVRTFRKKFKHHFKETAA